MSVAIDKVEPPDCYARALLIGAEVDLIRQEMGRARDPRPAAAVKGASPREVYFQALALFRKADRLGAEIVHDPIATVPHAPPAADIKPGHVLMVLDAAHRELAEIKQQLGVTEKAKEPARDGTKTPSDVFAAIVGINRDINLLLERPFSPADVFQQLSLAVAYAARLTGGEVPAAPAFESRKRPADCYDRLLGCLEQLRAVVSKAGHPVIEAPPARAGADEVLPSDVYDLAALVLAEVTFLHSLSVDRNPPYPFEGNVPGRKLPAHVYQLAGLLDGQLKQLSSR